MPEGPPSLAFLSFLCLLCFFSLLSFLCFSLSFLCFLALPCSSLPLPGFGGWARAVLLLKGRPDSISSSRAMGSAGKLADAGTPLQDRAQTLLHTVTLSLAVLMSWQQICSTSSNHQVISG